MLETRTLQFWKILTMDLNAVYPNPPFY